MLMEVGWFRGDLASLSGGPLNLGNVQLWLGARSGKESACSSRIGFHLTAMSLTLAFNLSYVVAAVVVVVLGTM